MKPKITLARFSSLYFPVNKLTGNPSVKRKKLADFGLTQTVYPANFKQPRHRHEFASLSFLAAGRLSENHKKKDRVFEPLTLIFHSARKTHAVEYYDRSVHILNIRLHPSFLSRFLSHSKLLDSSSSCRSENIVWLGNRLVKEFSQIDELSALAIEGIVIELLVEISRHISPKPKHRSSPWLNQAKEFLHDNFSGSIGLEEVAGVVGIHPVHLSRVFRRQFGCTMGEYVRRLRLEFAERQLSSTTLPLCEIALLFKAQ